MCKTVLRTRWLAAAVAVLGMGVTSGANAASYVGLTITGGLENSNVTGAVLPPGQHVKNYYVEQFNQPSYGTLSDERTQNILDLAGATVRSRASFADLGVHAQAWVMPKVPGVYGDWMANATASATFYDGWTVSASNLPAGTRATLDLTLELSGTKTTPAEHFNNSICVNFTVFGPDGGGGTLCPTGSGLYTLSAPILLNVDMGVSVGLSAWANAYNQWEPGSSTVDFYDSATVAGITVRSTDGTALDNVAISAASGHVYLPVPEPGTWATLSVGLLAMTASTVVRKRNRARVGRT